MAIERKVRARFEGTGNLTKRFGIMERAAARFGRKTENAFKRINKRGSRFKDITKGIVTGLGITRGLGLISRGIGAVTTQFIAFDKAALGATVRFKDIGPEAANFNEKLKEIKRAARDAGATTEFTAAQATEGLDFLARAGFNSAEGMGALNSMINLATASGEDFAQVADMSSDLLGAFGLNAKNTEQKIKNLNRVNDVLVKTANSTNVTIEDMFETMKIAAPIATTLGIEIEEVAALTGIMGNAGIKGSQGATALKNSFLNLATQKDPVMNMLKAIGVELQTGEGGRLKFTETLQAITEATKDMGKVRQAKVFDAIFGKRAIAGASNLSRNIGEIKEFREELINAGTTSLKTAEILRTSIDAKLKALGSAATEAGFKIFNAFAVDGKQGIDALTQSIRGLDLSGVVFLLRETLNIFTALFNVVSKITKPFAFLAAKAAELNDKIDLTGFISRGASQIGGGIGNVIDFLNPAFGGGETGGAPNAAEAQARAQAQQVMVNGSINVHAPPGTTAESDGDIGFNVDTLGFNGA